MLSILFDIIVFICVQGTMMASSSSLGVPSVEPDLPPAPRSDRNPSRNPPLSACKGNTVSSTESPRTSLDLPEKDQDSYPPLPANNTIAAASSTERQTSQIGRAHV